MKDLWTIIKTYFEFNHLHKLVQHQLDSYNHFINYQMFNTIQMFNPVIIHSEKDFDLCSEKYSLEIKITFSNLKINSPIMYENSGAKKQMFPQLARLRNFTYWSLMSLDLEIQFIVQFGENLNQKKIIHKKFKNVQIGKIPVMIKSNLCILNKYNYINSNMIGECKYDPGGYFIINGSEKTILCQERAAENNISCFKIKKNNNKWSYIAEIKSIPPNKCISPKQISIMISKKENDYGNPIYIQIPRVKNPIPIFILFRTLGIESDKDICNYILLDINNNKNKKLLFALKASILDSMKYNTKEMALEYLINNVMYTPINMTKDKGYQKKKEFAINILKNDLFPHCKKTQNKIYFLGYMINKIISCKLGLIQINDRDSYKNKRVNTTGVLLNNLFRNYFNKLVKDMSKQIKKEINKTFLRKPIFLTSIFKNIKITIYYWIF